MPQSNSLKVFLEMVRRGDFVVLDTETTGLDGEVCQIAVVDYHGNALVNTLVKPSESIPPAATAVHGIRDEDVAGALGWPEVLPMLMKVLRGRNVVVYNATYDRRMMHHSAERAGLPKVNWKAFSEWWCAMEAFAEIYGDWNDYHGNYRWQKLATAAHYYGISVEGAHNALTDCRITLAVVKAMAEVK